MTATLPHVTLKPPTDFVDDERSEKWELLEEGPLVEGTPRLDFLGFLREGETYINGETVLVRALEMDGFESGQHHLEWLLAQVASIPTELRAYHLVATGTKWRNLGRRVCIPCLSFRGGKWVLLFGGVDSGMWGFMDRVVRVHK